MLLEPKPIFCDTSVPAKLPNVRPAEQPDVFYLLYWNSSEFPARFSQSKFFVGSDAFRGELLNQGLINSEPQADLLIANCRVG